MIISLIVLNFAKHLLFYIPFWLSFTDSPKDFLLLGWNNWSIFNKKLNPKNKILFLWHRNALSIFTSLLNIIFSYDPVGYGLPYNYLMFTDSREALVEVCCQLLCVCLEFNVSQSTVSINTNTKDTENVSDLENETSETYSKSNLFISYISRIHRDEDFCFILKGFSRLLNNPMSQTILPGSSKRICFYQELLILFWKLCDYNKVH